MLRVCSLSQDLEERILGTAVIPQDTPPGDQEGRSTSDLTFLGGDIGRELFQEPGTWGVSPAGRQGLSHPLQTAAVNQQV